MRYVAPGVVPGANMSAWVNSMTARLFVDRASEKTAARWLMSALTRAFSSASWAEVGAV